MQFLFCFSTLKISFHCLLAPIVFSKKHSLFQISVLCKVVLVLSSFTIMCQDVIFLYLPCLRFIHLPEYVGSLFMSDFATPWTAAHQASLSFTISWSLPKLMSIELVMPSNHLILCYPLLLLPSIFPSIRVFPMSWLLASGGQSIGASASASVLPMNIQG